MQKSATISTQFIKCQCKLPQMTAKGQHFNITVPVSFQTHCARRQSQNRRKCLTALILSDCTDDCVHRDSSSLWQDLYLSGQLCHTDRCNEAAMQDRSMRSELSRPHCGTKVTLTCCCSAQSTQSPLGNMNLPLSISCSSVMKAEVIVDFINLHNNSLM